MVSASRQNRYTTFVGNVIKLLGDMYWDDNEMEFSRISEIKNDENNSLI